MTKRNNLCGTNKGATGLMSLVTIYGYSNTTATVVKWPVTICQINFLTSVLQRVYVLLVCTIPFSSMFYLRNGNYRLCG